MASINFSITFVIHLMLGLLSLIGTTEAAVEFVYHFCSNTTSFTPNSTHQANLNHLLSSLSSNSTNTYNNGFYNTTAGGGPAETIYGLFLCRGDVSTDVCRECVSTAAEEVLRRCPTEKVSVIWYAQCMLRYSNESIFNSLATGPSVPLPSTQNITNQESFNQLLADTMYVVAREAANDQTAGEKFAVKQANFTGFQTLYTLAQCTPDLTVLDCTKCLAEAVNKLPNCCSGKQGGRVLFPSCNVRYEIYPFYDLNATASPQPPLVPPTSKGSKSNNTSQIIIIIVVSVVALVILILCICIYLRVRKPKKKVETVDEIIAVESLQFDFSTVQDATSDFSDANKLGQGGFGAVYKGRLSNGQDIAVKRLSKNSGQGDQEFKNEVMLVAKLQHRNLVRLLGFCLEGSERLLIYEFVPNTSLDHFLFDRIKRANLDWERRYKIIGGIVRGLLYLHQDSRLRIIHRDLKASNILLDAEMNPKISDFGMARLFAMDQTQGNTSRIAGTYGYMAPEYVMRGHFSVKSDVYSFGVLVLEIITGQKNTSFRNGENVDLISCAWENWRDRTASNFVDPKIRGGSSSEIMRCIHIGLLCVQENISDRPTMASVALMLNSYYTLPVPSQPSFFMHSTIESETPLLLENYSGVTGSDKSQNISAPFSANEASITELYPR